MKPQKLTAQSLSADVEPEDFPTADDTAMPQAAFSEMVQILQAEKFRLETLVCYLLSLNEQLRTGQSHFITRPAATTEAAESTES